MQSNNLILIRYEAYTDSNGNSVTRNDLPTVAPVLANTISSFLKR